MKIIIFVLQSYQYLDLLAVLCKCDGVAIPDHQTYVTNKWLEGDDVSIAHLYIDHILQIYQYFTMSISSIAYVFVVYVFLK